MSELNETNEVKEVKEEKKEKCCCCHICEAAKKILVVAIGVFIGVYGSLSLFAATHNPAKKFHAIHCPCAMKGMHGHHMQNGFHPNKPGMFENQGPKNFEGKLDKKAPFKK